MKSRLAVFALVFALLIGGQLVDLEDKAHADTAFSFNLFYSSLSPYGNWVTADGYGYGWSPAQVGPNWQPYADGQWAWSDQGWTWVSYEPWGWATYHYGRWVYDPYYGWLWIPGTTWAPAWVSWYQTPGYVGWSPLPPDNNFFIEIGINIFDNDYYGYNGGYYGWNGWGYNGGHHHHHHHHKKGHYYDNDYYARGEHCVFVPQDKFTHKNAKLVALQGPDRLTVMKNVKNVTNIKVQNNKIYNYGPDKAGIERAGKGKLARVDLVDNNLTTLRDSKNPNSLNGNKYSVFRPNIEKKSDDSPYAIREQLNKQGNKNSFTSSEKGKGNGLVQDRNINTGKDNPYGNSSPEGFGVIKKNDTNTLRSNMGPDTGKQRDRNRDTFIPMNGPKGNEKPKAGDTKREFRSYTGPSYDNEPVQLKREPAKNNRQRNSYEAPAMKREPGNKSPYNYTQPQNRNMIEQPKPGNRRAINRAPVQQRNNYNPNGYQMQRPSNNYQPTRNTERNYSNNKRSHDSGNKRNTNARSQEYTSPSYNTGTRNFNPGNTRSSNNNSMVRNLHR